MRAKSLDSHDGFEAGPNNPPARCRSERFIILSTQTIIAMYNIQSSHS